MSDYLEKHCPELVKQIEEASEVGAARVEQPSFVAFVNRAFALSIINDQRERIARFSTALKEQEALTDKQQNWINSLYWLSGIGWGLAVGFGVLWGWK